MITFQNWLMLEATFLPNKDFDEFVDISDKPMSEYVPDWYEAWLWISAERRHLENNLFCNYLK